MVQKSQSGLGRSRLFVVQGEAKPESAEISDGDLIDAFERGDGHACEAIYDRLIGVFESTLHALVFLAFGCAAENAKISLLDEPAASGGTAGSSGTGNQGGTAGADAIAGGAGGANADSGSRCFDNDDCESRRCVAFTCVRCTSDAECGTAPYRYCNLEKGRCQQCLSPVQCPAGQVCAAETGSCETRCVENADCAGSTRPLCARSSGVCVECATEADCAVPRPKCEARSGLCVECLTNADCGGRWCEPGEYYCEGV